jgi:hypothetical protein
MMPEKSGEGKNLDQGIDIDKNEEGSCYIGSQITPCAMEGYG